MGCSASQEEIRIGAIKHFNRGNELMSQQNPRAAIGEYLLAIELDDEQPEFHYNLGLAYYQLILYQQAIAAYEEAIDLRPEFAEAWYNLSLAFDKIDESEKAFLAHDRYLKLRDKAAPPTENAPDNGRE